MMLDTTSFKMLQNILLEMYGVSFQYFESPEVNLTMLDMGIRSELSHSDQLYEKLQRAISGMTFGEIRVLLDNFHLHTILFPAHPEQNGFYAIGPFLVSQGTSFFSSLCKNNQLMIDSANLELLMQRVPTHFSRAGALIITKNILRSAGGIENPKIEEVDLSSDFSELSLREDINVRAERIEQVWVHERHILQYIQQGNESKALQEGSFFLNANIEQRLEDRIFSMRTLLYSVNTLFCRAAHDINVHPLFCDELSTRFARKLENSITVNQLNGLYTEMIHEYCELCRDQNTIGYSANIRKVMHYVQMNINQNLTPASIAENIGFSPSYLSRHFKAEAGITLNQYINRQRIIVARRLLKHTSMPIREVAEHCGISDWNYFTKIFRNEVGCTPTQFRKEKQSALKSLQQNQ